MPPTDHPDRCRILLRQPRQIATDDLGQFHGVVHGYTCWTFKGRSTTAPTPNGVKPPCTPRSRIILNHNEHEDDVVNHYGTKIEDI
jgi:hypothetical protein